MLKFFAEKMWVPFAVQKLLTFFSAKNIRILYIESAKTVNEMILNKLFKLTTLWTTGPWKVLYSFDWAPVWGNVVITLQQNFHFLHYLFPYFYSRPEDNDDFLFYVSFNII